MNHNIFYLFFITCCIVQISCLIENYPRVETPLGKIKGFYKISHKKNLYEAYEGIPYAVPPLGNRRFENPEPIKPWFNEIDATKKPNKCAQFDQNTKIITGAEDCLYLNVYVPLSKNITSFPVLVFIHGGGFQYGYSINNQPTHIIDKNLIIVTINYRLGAFGFLSTGDEVVPGNMGLKDQSVALRWIFNNIKYFGGDPTKITITGCSAGGSSVHYHYLSSMSTGLFQNGISSSGSVLSPWAYTENPLDDTIKLANILKCPTNSTIELVHCLKQLSANDIVEASKKILVSEYFSLNIFRPIFLPVAEKTNENYFINKPPTEIIKSKKFYDVPWIAGVSSAEGIAFTGGVINNSTVLSIVDKNWEAVGPYMMMISNSKPQNERAKVAYLSRKHYFGNASFEVSDECARKMINLLGHKVVCYDVQKAVKIHANVSQSSVKFYYYDYNWKKSNKHGVAHCDDCAFIFENDDFDPKISSETALMMESMLDFLYSVASGSDSEWKNTWSEVAPGSKYLNYVHIHGPNNVTNAVSDNFSENKFWESVEI